MRLALVLACACGRVGFDGLAAIDASDAAPAAACDPSAPCLRHAAPNSDLVVTCAATQPCRVDCGLAAACTVDCAGRDDCVVACPASACLVTHVPPDDVSISCGYVALPTRSGTTATCP